MSFKKSTARVGEGKGRQSAQHTIARKQGNHELADQLAPPSEKKMSEEERCGARTQTGNKCRSRKGAGTNHPGYGYCARHGGNTEAGVKSAARSMGRELVTRYKNDFLKFGGDRRDPSIATLTPEQALLEEVRRSAAMVRFLEERIGQWTLGRVDEAVLTEFAENPRKRSDESLQRHITELLEALPEDHPDSPVYLPPLTSVHPKTGITSFTDAREWLLLYREERGHLARVAKMCIDAGVAQRLVSIAEDQGRILSTAIRVVLTALNLTPDQQALVPVVVPQVLRAVATDSPIPDITSLTKELP